MRLEFEKHADTLTIHLPEELRGVPLEVIVQEKVAQTSNSSHDELAEKKRKHFEEIEKINKEVEKHWLEHGTKPEPWKFNRDEIYDDPKRFPR